jgi:hypothetical protein
MSANRRVTNLASAASLLADGLDGNQPLHRSRLVIIGDWPIAVRVLIADAARDGCGAVLLLAPITRLRGRGDTTRSRR